MKRLCAALLRQGIRTHTVDIQVPQVNVGAVILAEAESRKADLVVMGCYGRSRLSEFILGGATRYVLERTVIPVFMAH